MDHESMAMIRKQRPSLLEVSWFSMPEEGLTKSQQDQDWEGVVHHKHTPPGQTINKEYYLNVLSLLRNAICQKWWQLWTSGDWQLHHGNMPAHASCLVQSFLVKHQIIQVTQPPSRLDLAFLQTKITFEREEISDCWWDSGKYDRAANGDWRAVWGPKLPTLKGTEESLSCVQCFLCLLQ